MQHGTITAAKIRDDILRRAALPPRERSTAGNYQILLKFQQQRLKEAVRSRRDIRREVLDIVQEVDQLFRLLTMERSNA